MTPFLLLFVSAIQEGGEEGDSRGAACVRADIVSVVQEGLESVRVVKAYGRESLEETRLSDVSHETVDAALKARRVKSLLSPIVFYRAWRCAQRSCSGAGRR